MKVFHFHRMRSKVGSHLGLGPPMWTFHSYGLIPASRVTSWSKYSTALARLKCIGGASRMHHSLPRSQMSSVSVISWQLSHYESTSRTRSPCCLISDMWSANWLHPRQRLMHSKNRTTENGLASKILSEVLRTAEFLRSDHLFRHLASESNPKGDKRSEEKLSSRPSTAPKPSSASYGGTHTQQRGKQRLKASDDPTVERNFITAVRAMGEFLLKPQHLENLRKTLRRSPYENEPPITVFWRKDVEDKALEVWGSKDALDRERMSRKDEVKRRQQAVFYVKKLIRDMRQEEESAIRRKNLGPTPTALEKVRGSKRVVVTAIAINAANSIVKLVAWVITGSHSMFSEMLHSIADTLNQVILAVGIDQSIRRADMEHPYGYSPARYVASLISGVGIFCVGAGVSVYHGINGLIHPQEIHSLFWAYCILGGSFVSEGGTLILAINSIKNGAHIKNMTFFDYVMSGQDPSVNVVLLEDAAAVLGLGIAGMCMGLTSMTGSPIPDAIGSLLVGALLAQVSLFIISTNSTALVGRSIPHELLLKINNSLEQDRMIRAIHDVKGIDMGNSLIRYKAEIDIDGRELTRRYLDATDLEILLEEMKQMKNIDEVEAFLLKHGENIVDLLGAEIDRIESLLKKTYPEVRHCDLEVL
ncbi:unnamed protein product [Darwinula stevensoni]|uniref:Proton-coupled zinc antiporter SLC30A9, mitochondrial n=1 Tax=Darwinula stevensoni TaxID=69355 RepID=A0A7R8X2E1_9CRUS|nr:unnamed protein product [Darwinula stevensoni]CAG0883825.1 unnamed protein product [Darwinula stevensoni]